MRFPGKSAPAATASAGSSKHGNGSTFSLGVLAAMLVCAAAFLGIGAPAASAAQEVEPTYGYLTSFIATPGFEWSFGNGGNNIAVDSSGNIFVSHPEPPRIEVFSPDATAGGVPLETIDLSSPFGEEAQTLPVEIAIDSSNDSLLLRTSIGHVWRLLSDGQPIPTYTLDPSFEFFGSQFASGGLAVSPSTHNVVSVATNSTGSKLVAWIDATGSLLRTIPSEPRSLAPDGSGGFYVAAGPLEHYSSDGSKLENLPLPSGFGAINLATNAQTGELVALIAGYGQFYLQGYSSAGEPTFRSRLRTETFNQPVGEPNGLAWDPVTDRIYYLTRDEAVHVFVPASAPGLETPVASEVAGTSAKIEVGVAPAGSTKVRIELCPVAPAYKSCSEFPLSNPEDPGNPWQRIAEEEGLTGAPTTITAEANGLIPDTTYQVRAWAANETAGTEATSEVAMFRTPQTPPGVVTGPPLEATDTEAELSGEIDTFGSSTTYHFEYGLTTNYGSQVPAGADAPAGNIREPRTFTQRISGLQAGTTYHYRLVAQNAAGTAAGADRTFTTQGADEVAPSRAYEQVSPRDKEGAAITGATSFLISPDGNNMVVPTAGLPEGAGGGTMVFSHFATHREAEGWSPWTQTDPPFGGGVHVTLESSTFGVSEDFNHALVVSPRVLAPGAQVGDGNLYVHDLRSGTYSFVGRSAPSGVSAMAGLLVSQGVFVSGAEDFDWVIFHAPPLMPGVTKTALYKWSRTDGLTLLSRMPDGSPATLEVAASNFFVPIRQSSADGTVAYFNLKAEASGYMSAPVYRREQGVTIPISVSHIPGDPSTPQPGILDGVSASGRYAVFQSNTRLTTDTPITFQAKLYRYDSQDETLQYVGLTFENETSIEVSADGQSVLYVDPGSGMTTLWHDGANHPIATSDVFNPSGGVSRAQMSPNGRYVVYLNEAGIYPLRPQFGTVSLYDAVTEESICVSCPPSGAAGKNEAFIGINQKFSNVAPQAVTDSGTVFFDTPVKLVAADHNSKRDVYAFQHGRASLISPADGDFTAEFVTSSDEGRDVFFTTEEGLVGQDTDRAVDMYDARIGGGFASQNPPPPPGSCIRAECGPLGGGAAAPVAIGSLAQGAGATPQAKVSVKGVRQVGRGLKVRVHVNLPGRVRVAGPEVVPATRKVKHAGTFAIDVRLARKARERVDRSNPTKIHLKVSLNADGSSASTAYVQTFGK